MVWQQFVRHAKKFIAKMKREYGYGWQEVWQRLTRRAREVIFYTDYEVQRLGHSQVGTEHLLLGLTHATDSVAACILERMGVSLEHIYQEIDKLFAFQANAELEQEAKEIQLTLYGRRVLELACEEADDLDDCQINTGHLLLGLLREREGMAAQILNKLGVDLELARTEMIKLCLIDGFNEP